MEYKVKETVPKHIYKDVEQIANTSLPWEKLKNKTLMITGANGFISYYLVAAIMLRNDLYQDNIKVIGIVRSTAKAEKKFGDLAKRQDIKLVVQDICDSIRLEEPVDYVIHAASHASAYYFENDPVGTIDANLSGTSNVLKFAKEKGTEATLFISSLKVYGQVKDGSSTLHEDNIGYVDQTDYKNCYAVGKRASETLCASYCKQYGMNIKIARPSYIYGPSSLEDDRVWAQFIANVVKGESILLKSNGGAYRSFCYVTDTVTALLMILLNGKNAIPYNIAADHSNTTIRNFAREAVKVFPERNLTLSFANKEDEAEPDLTRFTISPEILDHSRIDELGWKAEVDLAEGIKRSVETLEEITRA